MDIQEIINNIAAGENVAAKEGLENVLSAKAFDALQGYKQEIASALYAGQDEQPEEDTDHEEDEEEGAYAEGVEHDEDQEQLDELSKTTLASYQHKSRESFNKALKQMDANPVDLKYHHPGGMVDRGGMYRGEQRTKAAEVMKKRTTGFNRSYDRIGPNFDHVKK